MANDIKNTANYDLKYALELHQNGCLAEAKEIYCEILHTNPKDFAVLHLLGILFAQENDLSQAINYLTKALKIDENSALIHNSLGNVYKKNQDYDKALMYFTYALKQQQDNPILHNNIGIVYQNLQNYPLACEHYAQAIKLQQNYADAHFNYSLALIQMQACVQAKEHLKIATELQPKHTSAWCQLAQLEQQDNNVLDAIKCYQKSLRLDKHNITAQHNLGCLLLAKQKYYSAIRHFKKVLLLEPLHQEAFYNIGIAFIQQSDYESALKYFLRLAQLTKNKDYEILYNLGVIYNALQRTKEAIYYFTEVVKLNPQHFPAYLNLGVIYLKAEKHEQAELYYAEALKLEPNNQEIIYTLDAIRQNQQHSIAPKDYVSNLFDSYASYYDKHLHHLAYQAPELICHTLKELNLYASSKILHILDLGCGTGLCGEKLTAIAKKLVGVDISKQMLKIAQRKKLYHELHHMKLEEFLANNLSKLQQIGSCVNVNNNQPNSAELIDLIIAGDTLPYIGDLTYIFQLCAQILRYNPQSCLVFTLEKYTPLSEHASQNYFLQKTLRFAHSEEYIEQLAKNNNFTIYSKKKVTIRKQHNIDVPSLLYVLQIVI